MNILLKSINVILNEGIAAFIKKSKIEIRKKINIIILHKHRKHRDFEEPKEVKKISRLWSEKVKIEDIRQRESRGWMLHPYISRWYINKNISGDPQVNMLIYFKNKYIPNRLQYGLVLGCGDGGLERHALSLGICEKFDSFDIAAGAIDIAKKIAVEQGIENRINYKVKNINKIKLEENKYDIAFAFMSAHHFRDLEHVFSEVKKSLKPARFFMLDEYTGPSQFQWTNKQLKIVNDLLEILPIKYRRLIPYPDKIKKRVERPSLKWMNEYDPSEAIRSAEIIPLLSKYFEIIEHINYGGSILHILLKDIAGKFKLENEVDMAFLKLLCYIEHFLINEDIIKSDFSGLVVENSKK